MRNYEAVIILAHQSTGDREKDLLKKVDGVFSKFNAKVTTRHDRGKKTLGHAMKKHREGHVYILDFEIDPAQIDGLSKDLRLEEDLLQVMISLPVVSQAAQSAKRELQADGR